MDQVSAQSPVPAVVATGSASASAEGQPGFAVQLEAVWRQIPNKGLFFGLLAAWLALFHFWGNATLGYIRTPSLLEWMHTAYTLKSPIADDAHGMLIPFVILALLWWKREELLKLEVRPWWPGLVLVAAALGLHVLGFAVQQPRVSIVAMLGGIYALTGVVWGPAFLRATFFPFFLFAFMVPLGSLTEGITFPLRLAVTRTVSEICQHVLAINVVCNGTQLFNSIGTYQYDVAPACSGIRSLIAITALSIIFAFTQYRDWPSRLVIMASAVPLAFLGNVFRMMVIVLAAEFGGQSAGNRAHESTFWSMLPYVPAILGLILLGRWLDELHARRRQRRSASAAIGGTS
ncbi:MAG: exosortase/archaeosortase family protein [Verrucomicrobiae bacterium]|nr:exosortase/archaeosortase family protein [Verrucomicrobiae bacterium]